VGNVPQAIGTGILVSALLFIVYSLCVFHYRRKAIVSRKIDGHYDDSIGPTIMVCILFVYLIAALVFHITYVKPVPFVTNARTIRDYRIPISPSYLSIGGFTSTGLNNLKNAIQSSMPDYPLRGNFNFGGALNVTWYDTRSSCLLRRNGYILTELTGMNYTGYQTTNCALEYRTEDWEYINQFELNYPTTFFNATEIIEPNGEFLYSRGITKGYYQNPDLLKMSNLAGSFNTFFLWDVISPASWTETLEAINPNTVYLYYYGTVNTNLKSSASISRLVSLGVYVWYRQDFTPIWGELSYSFPIAFGTNVTTSEILEAKNYYDKLTKLLPYLAPNSTDITDIIYASQPTFCL